MQLSTIVKFSAFTLLCGLLLSCSQKKSSDQSTGVTWQSIQDKSDVVTSITGFSGPEAVRYDPDQDVYFVSNFNGPGGEKDANGFISKISPEGTIHSLRFMTGTETNPLHAPRGMYITGDTLWVADASGVHGFNRLTGTHVNFVDFTNLEIGFLNDVVEGDDGNLYVTDTGTSTVFVIEDGTPSVLVDSLPAPPNGITTDPEGKLVLGPWQGIKSFPTVSTSPPGYSEYTVAKSGGNFDGIEFLDGRMIAASQLDSSLHVFYQGNEHIAIKTPGKPADIGLDTKRNQIAVPYIDLNTVDIWQLPERK